MNAIFPLPSYQGYDIFIIYFEYGDSEYWEMCISDKGIINENTQKMTVHYTWDDWEMKIRKMQIIVRLVSKFIRIM